CYTDLFGNRAYLQRQVEFSNLVNLQGDRRNDRRLETGGGCCHFISADRQIRDRIVAFSSAERLTALARFGLYGNDGGIGNHAPLRIADHTGHGRVSGLTITNPSEQPE